uniref:Cadherin domain-containing protein n=1 Tax=Anopheles maculatus TaxID=74869 RepID=A0A182T654_9DIPT
MSFCRCALFGCTIRHPPLDRDQPNGRPQWRFTVFAQDEGGEGLVGYADVQVNLKDINDNAPIFPQGVYFGNVTENGTAGMVVMTMTAVDYDDPNEGKWRFIFRLFSNRGFVERRRDTHIIGCIKLQTLQRHLSKCSLVYTFLSLLIHWHTQVRMLS